uniref:Ribosomal protein S4 n=1 Tax=California macrophylla TaxID=337344 RepID=A0A0G2YFC4_9ROSI|nr:ribosomal protein S4 [California macrophylla]
MSLATKFGGLVKHIVSQNEKVPTASMLNSVCNMATGGFKACRRLQGNVWNKELTWVQRRILKRLRRDKKNMKSGVHSRGNLNSYIRLQTTRKLSLFYGNLPITKMHRATGRTSYIPFLLNLETRLDVLLVRSHFCQTIPQARQLISHQKVCVNGKTVTTTHMKVPQGSLISFQEKDAKARAQEVWKYFYIKTLVDDIIGKFGDQQKRTWKTSKAEWIQLLKSQRGVRVLLNSPFLKGLRHDMQEEDLERSKKFRSEKLCLGSSLTEHNRLKRSLYQFKYLLSLKRMNKKDRDTSRHLLMSTSLYSKGTNCAAPPHKDSTKRRIRKVELPTHYLEVNYKTLQAVVFYGPNIAHIPHNIRLADIQ